jgi:hypothetical protein
MEEAINESLKVVKDKYDGHLLSDNNGFPITSKPNYLLVLTLR